MNDTRTELEPPTLSPATDAKDDVDVYVIDPHDFARAMAQVVDEELVKAIRRRQGKVD